MRPAAQLFVATLVAFPVPALARQDAATSVTIPAQEAQDAEIVRKAMNSGSLAAAKAYQADLVAVLGRAPERYPLIERSEGRMLIRSTAPQGGLMASLSAAVAHEKNGEKGRLNVFNAFNTYGAAAFLLGSLAMEAHDPAGAIAYLDRGLAMQPDNLLLVTEKGTALVMTRRLDEALALYETAERLDDTTKDVDPAGEARLLRSKGFVLIELNRLKEAEAAYVAALKLEPDHAGAKTELEYIRRMNKGAQATPMRLLTGDKAKDGDTAAPAKP